MMVKSRYACATKSVQTSASCVTPTDVVSAEEEARRILDAAVLPSERVRIGSGLAAVGSRFGGIELDIARDPAPAEGVSFEA